MILGTKFKEEMNLKSQAFGGSAKDARKIYRRSECHNVFVILLMTQQY